MTTISNMKEFLKTIGSTHSFRTKQRYVDRIDAIKSYTTFPWR